MRRWAFNLAVIASLLILLMAAGLWVRSYIARDTVWRGWMRYEPIAWLQTTSVHFSSHRGHLGVDVYVSTQITMRPRVDMADLVAGPYDGPPYGFYSPSMAPDYWEWEDDELMPDSIPTGSFANRLGFAVGAIQVTGGTEVTPTDRYYVYVPYWLWILLAALLPAAAIRRWRHHRRLQGQGHCRTCGYDLRATPNRCPECGTVAAEAAR